MERRYKFHKERGAQGLLQLTDVVNQATSKLLDGGFRPIPSREALNSYFMELVKEGKAEYRSVKAGKRSLEFVKPVEPGSNVNHSERDARAKLQSAVKAEELGTQLRISYSLLLSENDESMKQNYQKLIDETRAQIAGLVGEAKAAKIEWRARKWAENHIE